MKKNGRQQKKGSTSFLIPLKERIIAADFFAYNNRNISIK
jgi:hypothetical protein